MVEPSAGGGEKTEVTGGAAAARAFGGGGGGMRGIARAGGGGGTRAGGGGAGGLLSMAGPWYASAHRTVRAREPRRRIPAIMRSPAALSRHRALRWNDGSDVDRYDAVETRDDGLLWYTWSHAMGAEVGGRRHEVLQSLESFRRDGPARREGALPVPDRVVAALRAWIDERP